MKNLTQRDLLPSLTRAGKYFFSPRFYPLGWYCKYIIIDLATTENSFQFRLNVLEYFPLHLQKVYSFHLYIESRSVRIFSTITPNYGVNIIPHAI